jgi:predicted dehydrogenase
MEAGRTLLFDREKMIQAADDGNIAILSMSADEETVGDLEGLGWESMRLGNEVGQGMEDLVAAKPLVTVTNSAPRVAVVGVGYFGKFHAAKYAALKESNLVAVVDVKHNRARRVAENFSCQAYFSHLDLIGKVDAASVAVPTQDHCLVARDLMEAGIHVLVEKPMTTTLEEANSLIQIAKAKNLVCQVGYVERFNPALLAAAEYVHQPSFLEAHRLAPFTGRETEVDVILDLMIHDIDIILSLVPYELKYISAGGAKFLTAHPDICSVRLEFTNGCTASVTASRISARAKRTIRIFQPDSYLSVDYKNRRVELFRKLPKLNSYGSPEVEYRRLPVADIDPLEEQLRHFACSVRTQTKPLITGETGRKALEVATAVSRLIKQQTERD